MVQFFLGILAFWWSASILGLSLFCYYSINSINFINIKIVFYASSAMAGKVGPYEGDLLPDRPKMVATKLFFLSAFL